MQDWQHLHYMRHLSLIKSTKIRYLMTLAVGISIVSILAVSMMPDQFADAGSRKKIHFTDTVTSSQDPGLDSKEHQLAMLLSPNKGTLFDGSITWTASRPVQAFILHEIDSGDVQGQPTWTVNGDIIYGLSLIDMAESGSLEFTGAALGLYSTEKFTATASIDGWIRGQPTDIITQKIDTKKVEPAITLYNEKVLVTIPMNMALYDGKSIYYIMTDSSDEKFAQKISEIQEWRVELATSLSDVPDNILQDMFIFTNGVKGDGLYGYQYEVLSKIPKDAEFSALGKITEVTWKKGQKQIVLESAQDIWDAEKAGRIEFKETEIVVNAPQIVWPGGQMVLRENVDEKYDGGQITNINTEEMTVTFIAHRGWGPDGSTTYHLVTDATPSGPADVMGVPHSPSLAELITSSAAVDMFSFQNGVRGSGPLGFQSNIAGATQNDSNYSPIWRIYIIEWNDTEMAQVLETRHDIDSAKENKLISTSIARPMNSEYVVNYPMIDPFQ